MRPSDRSRTSSNQSILFRTEQSSQTLPHEHRKSNPEAGATPGTFSLTRALRNAYPQQYLAATQSPFLKAAGLGHLPKDILSKWLSQDRLYAETYICFITSLIARVHLPYSFVTDKSKSLRWRIVNLLTGALQNIHNELDFFTKTAEKYGLDLQTPMDGGDGQYAFTPVHATQQYMDLFRSFHHDPSLPLIEGMVVLWATEQCYLDAWTHASQIANDSESTQDADGGALRSEFIPNWSSEDFKKFVDDIAEVTDLLAERENAGKKIEVYKAVWSHVLDIEARFWPSIET